jgi:hypothetical protein
MKLKAVMAVISVETIDHGDVAHDFYDLLALQRSDARSHSRCLVAGEAVGSNWPS